MPDKHEVGGSSPLGPTRNLLKKDFTFSLFTLHSSLLAKKKERKERRNGDNYKPFYGGVAQLGEHLPCKQGVMGSNPIISTRPQCGRPNFDQLRRESEDNTRGWRKVANSILIWAHSSAG